MQTPPDLHSRAATARREHLAEVRGAPSPWTLVAAAGWLAACGLDALASTTSRDAAFLTGAWVGSVILTLILALVFQAVGRLFYPGMHPFRDVFGHTLFAIAAALALVLAWLSAADGAAG